MLQIAVEFSPNSSGAVAADPATGEFVVFRETGNDVFHAYAVTWNQLTQAQKNALINAGQVTVNGTIK